MTEAVNFVVGKLGEIIDKEGQLLRGVGEQLKWVQRELANLQPYISIADSQGPKKDNRAGDWLNELTEVANGINVAIDVFVEDNRQKKNSMQKLKKLSRKTKELHELERKVGAIQKKLKGIAQSRIDYKIEPLQDTNRGDNYEVFNSLGGIKPLQPDVDESEVVGLDIHKNKILELLRDEKIRRRAVITIVGIRGLGKTTLAQIVYKSAMKDFEYHIILRVSKPFNRTDLLLKMLQNFENSDPMEQDVDDNLVIKLRYKLSGLRYLIILDDVCNDDWNKLKDFLPDNENGSRVLMTSRSIDVAKSADPTMEPYVHSFLNNIESRDLFRKCALYKKCPSDLLGLADELSKICRGFPLALVELGGSFSTIDPTYRAWKERLDTADHWLLHGLYFIETLIMSYQDMPYHLKACFLYLASFPEGYEISAKRLIRIWVAEGFIPLDGRKTMEEIAVDCLDQLFQRSMVHVSSRHLNGSIRKCQVHVLNLATAIYHARMENFITAFPEPRCWTNFDHNETRRASLQSCDPQLIKHVGQNTVSLLFFSPKDVPRFNRFQLLKVLEIVDVDIPGEKSLRGLDKLIQLKYLGIRARRGSLTVPLHSLAHLQNLETLDLRGQYMGPLTLPSDFWAIDTLRHVLYDDCIYGMPPNANLRNLQTIKWVAFDEKPWPINKIPCLTNLRSLGLHGSYNHWNVAAHLLGTLPFLISLRISAHPIPNDIIYPTMLPYFENLQTLFLCGSWSDSVTLDASLFPKNLIKLTLWGSDLSQDPMEELGKLTSLKRLKLRGKVYRGKQMLCPAGFPNLESLVLDLMDVEVFTIAQGIMPKLKSLEKYRTTKVEMPPNKNLETLFLYGGWSESVTFNASFFPKKLIKLTLWDSDLLQDPMEELGKLTKLRDLRLRGNVYMAEQMICPAGFPVLQNLLLDLKYVKVFKVAGGVMPKLESLKNSRDTTLEMPPELKHLTGN